jgi:hypothetical protein
VSRARLRRKLRKKLSTTRNRWWNFSPARRGKRAVLRKWMLHPAITLEDIRRAQDACRTYKDVQPRFSPKSP